ncbi:MAG TPA: HDIG domain-containing protein [bacterium]|jgi:hypothetical protein
MNPSDEGPGLISSWWRKLIDNPDTPRIAVAAACFLLVFAVTTNHMLNPRSAVPHVGDIARRDFAANRDTTYIDSEETAAAKIAAEDAIRPVYTADANINAGILSDLTSFFVTLDSYSVQLKNALSFTSNTPVEHRSTPIINDDGTVYYPIPDETPKTPAEIEDEAVTALLDKLDKALHIRRHLVGPVTDEDIKALLGMDFEAQAMIKSIVDSSIRERILGLIQQDESSLVDALEVLRNTVITKIENTSLNANEGRISILLAGYFLRPNATIDQAKTQEERARAREAASDVIKEVSEGEIFLRAGERVTQEDVDIMVSLGMTAEAAAASVWINIVLFTVVLGIAFLLGITYLPGRSMPQLQDLRFYLLFYTILIIGYLSSFFLLQTFTAGKSGSEQPIYMLVASLPMVGTAVLFSHYFTRMLSATVTSFMAITITIASGEPALLLPSIFPSLAASLLIRRDCPKNLMIRAIIIIPVLWAISVLAIIFSATLDITVISENWWILLLGMIPAPIAMLLSNVVLDTAFNIPTASRLREFDSQDHPLLRKLQLEAPGTWHHSMMVGLIAEAACQALGGNSLLVRVACMYHDIGKAKRPEFFIENQRSGSNVHDKYSPWLSKIIVESHVKDGIAMARAHGLPEELVGMIPQHHGTTLIKYFFRKALAMSEDGYVNEYDYRYPGPKPQSLEAACINLADACESATRSLEEPTPHRIKALVERIYEDRLLDGQYDECGLALNQLEIIKETIIERLIGAYHARIEYPEEDELRRQFQLKRAEGEKPTSKKEPLPVTDE